MDKQLEEYRRLTALPAQTDSNKTKMKGPGDITVGIIGAGMSGFYAAILLNSLGIKCEILEANPDRLGGRIYTYRFNGEQGLHAKEETREYFDYFDVGAMRFPKVEIMDRVIGDQSWSLINFLNRNVTKKVNKGIYYFSMDNNPLYFNNTKILNQQPLDNDALKFGDQYHGGKGSAVPDEYVAKSYDTWLNYAYEPFKHKMHENMSKGFKALMRYDTHSTRSFMQSFNLEDVIKDIKSSYKPPGVDPKTIGKYPEAVVSWCETMDSASGLYNLAFSESVIDSFTFEGSDWACIEGGSDRMVEAMKTHLDTKKVEIIQGRRVTAIKHESDSRLSVVVHNHYTSFHESHSYDHVISTLPLGVLRNIDTSSCNLTYNKKLAIRTLQYDHSVKIGIRFTRRWWADKDFMKGKEFKAGRTLSDLPLRTVVFPSYGTKLTDPTGVLLASYTWAQDATRLAALIHSTEDWKKVCVNMCLESLSRIYGDEIKKLYSGSCYMWDWYNDPYSQGAFALFGPGQFASFFPSLILPAAEGNLHFAGEATSIHHAWVVGSLNSAYRTVWEILRKEGWTHKIQELKDLWGTVEDVELNEHCDEKTRTEKLRNFARVATENRKLVLEAAKKAPEKTASKTAGWSYA